MDNEYENNDDIHNEYIDFLDNEYIFRQLDNMSQLKILTYLLPYEIHRLSKKTYTKKIKKKILVKRKRNKNKYYALNPKKNINLFYKGLRLSYKFVYHRCKSKECCRSLIDTDYKLWDEEKRTWIEDNDNKPKNKFYYGYCNTCEHIKRADYICDNRNLRLNGTCLLLDSSDDEE